VGTYLPGGTEKKTAGVVGVDMLWCQGAQNIGLSNRILKSALTCIVWWSQCTSVPERQTDRRTDGQTDGRWQ